MAEFKEQIITEQDIFNRRQLADLRRRYEHRLPGPLAHLGGTFFTELYLGPHMEDLVGREPEVGRAYKSYALSNVAVDLMAYGARGEIKLLRPRAALWGEVNVPTALSNKFGGQING